MPVGEAQYYALLSRAFPGGVTRHEMQWDIDLVEGWSAIHAAGIIEGQSWIWPDARLSKSGRAMLRVQSLRDRFRSGTWKPTFDL